MSPSCFRWRRMYLGAEHARRRQLFQFQNRERELLRTMGNLRETINMLHAEIRRSQGHVRSHKRAIDRMRAVLAENNLTPALPATMSFKVCNARDEDEVCPLAMEPINRCAPPFDGCCVALNPLKQGKRCAELILCGHRFNGVWLMYHFVRNRTFRCPICRRGEAQFRFDPHVVPACMQRWAC